MIFQLDQKLSNTVDKKQLAQSIITNEEKEEIVIDSSEISNQIFHKVCF